MSKKFIHEATAAYDDAKQERFIGDITITKLVRENIPVKASTDGGSFGTLVDAHILQCLEDGEDVTELTIAIQPDHWEEMKLSFLRR